MEKRNPCPSAYAKQLILELMQDEKVRTIEEIREALKEQAPAEMGITEKHIGGVLYREIQKGRLKRTHRGTYQWNAEYIPRKKGTNISAAEVEEEDLLVEKLARARKILKRPIKLWELSTEELKMIPQVGEVIRQLEYLEQELRQIHGAKR